MKSFFKYLTLSMVVTSGIITGCSKKEVIELSPEFTLSATTNPSTIQQLEEVLLGTYARFRAGDYYGSNSGTGAGWTMMPDVMSDNLYENNATSLANSRNMSDFLYLPNTGQVAAFYSAPYQVITGANIVLRDADKFLTATNQTRINRIKGQALAIRALAHFDLMRYFAVNFDRNSTTNFVAPYTTEFVVSTTLFPSRLSNKDYWDKIFEDLNAAEPLLQNVDRPINPATGVTRPFIDLNAFYAIKARACLYAGDWQGAETAATNAMNNRPLVNLDQAAFSGMYNESSRGEIIWNVQFDAGQGGPTFLVYFATTQRNYFNPTAAIATVSGTSGLIQNTDIRYRAFFTEVVSGELSVTKYRGKQALSNGNANVPVFRTGEMMLIRAEARARNNREALGLQDLNALRAARINGYVNETGLTGQALLTAIANERRRELFCEGHRFFDLKRTTRTLVRTQACGGANDAQTTCSLDPNAREWALPIPVAESDINPNAGQNPGYN
jgi:hypothetical protein